MWFCNGYDTSGKYWVPTGNTDSTGGRADRIKFDGSGAIIVNSGAASGASASSGQLGDFIQYAHLTGTYMGELSDQAAGSDEPQAILTPIYSPAKKPFLCVQSNRNLNPLSQKVVPDAGGKPALIYDGNLNSIGDYDVFSIRFCAQAFKADGGEADWQLDIKAGFGSNTISIGSIASDNDYGVPAFGGTPLLSHIVDSTGTGFKAGFSAKKAFFDWVGNTEQAATSVVDWWQDLDFVMDYTNNQFDVFHNGTLVSSNVSFGTSGSASDMVGFQIDLGPKAGGTGHQDNNWQGVLLVDRTAMCFPLTDHPDQSNIPNNEVAMTNMKWDSGVNRASTLNLTVADDKNVYSSKVKDIIQASTYSYSSLLVFRDNIDHSNCARPIWRGTVTNVSQTQGTGGKTGSSGTIKHSNVLKINATDYSSLLDHQIPNWEIGQGGDADSTQTISFMRGETQNKLDMYYFGVEKLQASNANLGFDYSDGTYIPYVDSRMRRNSAHPIQVYNNENTLGPNDVEDSWVSQTVTAAYRDGSNKPVMFTPSATNASSIDVKFEDSNLVAAGDHTVTGDALVFGNQNPLPVIVFDSATALSTENATLVSGTGNVNGYSLSTTLASSSINAPISTNVTVSGGGTIYEEQDGATEIKVVIDTSTAHGLRVGQIVEFDDVFSGSADAGYSNLGVYPLNENGEEFPIDFEPTESTLSSDAAIGATTLNLSNAAQFPTNGTAKLYVKNYAQAEEELGWSITISWTGKISNQLTGVTGVTHERFAGSRIRVISAKYSGLNNVPVAVQRVLTATRFRVSYKYDGLSSVLGSFGAIPHTGASSPIVTGTYFANDKVAAVDVSNFPESGSITGYDGTNDFDYAGIDRENNLFTGVSGFSGTLSPGATLTYGVSNTPTEQTELTITGTSLGLSKNDYIGLDETNGMDGLWRIVEAPSESGGNTKVRITLDYAGTHDGTANGKARWSDSSVRLAGNWNQNYRSIHARWIRDIVASKWTQHMFGRIEKDDAGTGDLQADYAIGGSEIRVDSVWPYAALKDGGSFEIIDADGNIDAGLCTSASGVTDRLISKGFKYQGLAGFAASGTLLSNGDKITIRGSSIEAYNGAFIIHNLTNIGTVSQKFNIKKPNGAVVSWEGQSIQQPTATVLSGSYLTLTLPTNNMLSRAHSTGATLKARSFKDDYKHLWVLWSDMRNTDKADADGGKKKSDFGLLYPNNQNYGLTLQWAEQDINAYDGRDAFTDLKIGEDVEIWAMDSLVEPVTGGLWSALGSNSEANTIFHNWENKAGTFVIIDTSKFFNLNTESNRGRTGQLSGGTKELGDFLIETEGFPVLIDNYWSQAPATANTADGGIVRYHRNAQNFISDPSLVRSDIADGDKWIQLEDVSKFATQGQGKIVSQKEDKVWFYWWTAKGINLTISALSTTGTTTPYTTEITTSANHELTAGMEVTVTCTSSTPNVSLTTRIVEVTAANKFTIQVPAQITGAGTDGSVVDTNSLYVGERSVIFEGRKSDGTGNWNGFSYNSTDITNTDSSKTAEQLLIDAGNAGGVSGVGTLRVTPNANNQTPDYTDLTAYNSLSNVFPMRLLMQLEGFVKSPNSGTFYEHDKVRVAWNDSMLKVWLGQAVLTAPYDIHTVPISNNMNTSQKSVETSGVGGYITAMTTADPSVLTSAGHGLSNGDIITITNADEVSGTNLTVANATTNTFTVGKAYDGSGAVAPMWWKVSEFDDFGSINDARSSTIMGLIASSRDGSGTGDTNGETVTYSWLIGRDGHICYRPTYGSGFSFVANDATPANNNLIVSDMNAQSMNQITNVRVIYSGGASFVDYPSATLGTRARWKIIDLPNVSNQAEAETVAKQEYNKQKQAPLSLKAKVQRLGSSDTFDGEGDVLLSEARYGYIADPSRRSVGFCPTYWTAQLGGCLFPGMVSGLNGPQRGAADTGAGPSTRAWSDWYYWYGANSVAYAVQIVDIPRGMPKTSEGTAGAGFIVDTLRIAIAPDDSANATLTADDNPRFKIWLGDFKFKNTASSNSPDRTATKLSESSIVVQGNGIYEIGIPSTYWSSAGTAKIRISVNYDYLLALLRYRCGDTTASDFFRPAHAPSTFTATYGAYNTSSIFPLGMREYSELGAYGEERSEWYAPRILITDDVNFVPATTIDYTDSFLGLTNEPMVITNMSYSVSGANVENLVFSLERDAARQAVGFNTMFQPQSRKSQLTAGLDRGRATEEPNGPWSPDWIGSSVGGGSGGGRGHGPALGGAFTGSGGWGGDTNPNTNMSSQFSPLQNPTPSGPDSPGAATSSSPGITSGAISSGFNSKVKGKMDLNIDAQVGGNFSILGQNKAGAAPSTTSGISAEIPFSPSGGSATVGDNGLIFPGTVGESTNYPQHSFTASIPVPNNVKSKFVAISANANLVGDSTNVGVLTTTVSLSGFERTTTTTVKAGNNGRINLFSGIVDGADVAGGKLQITISRTPDDGTDTAKYSSIAVSNVQVGINRQSVQGTTMSDQMTFSGN